MGEISLTDKIRDYIRKRLDARLEKLDKDAEKARKAVASDSDALAAFDREYGETRSREIARYQPAEWLTEAAARAHQITMVTHALKYTHSDAKGTSLLATAYATDSTDQPLVTTAAIAKPAVDAVGNAAALDVAGLLQLRDESGHSLLAHIADKRSEPLQPLAASDTQLQAWLQGFAKALSAAELSSHTLAKQVYFPVGDDSYHLLGPLFSSAMAQAIHDTVMDTRFSDPARAARAARKNGKYHPRPIVDFPQLAVQNFGGTKPQNISQLNTGRRGQAFLLCASPPKWRRYPSPPSSLTAFMRRFEQASGSTVRFLAAYLKQRVNAPSTLAIRAFRARIVDELIDNLQYQAALVHSRKDWAGWSDTVTLSPALKCWLDPHNPNEELQRLRNANDWPHEVGQLFAGWLNRKLRKGGLNVADGEHREWQTLAEDKCNELLRQLGGVL